jgi:hypothetical protein
MGRTFYFIVTAIALTVMLYVSGITTDSGSFSSTFINQVLGNNDVSSITFWSQITLAIAIMTGGLVLASVAGNASTGIAAANGFLGVFLVNFVTDYFHVINKAKESCDSSGALCGEWVYWVISIIFIPIIGGFLFTMYEWVTGGD